MTTRVSKAMQNARTGVPLSAEQEVIVERHTPPEPDRAQPRPNGESTPSPAGRSTTPRRERGA